MICPVCMNKVEDDDIYCGKCGVKIQRCAYDIQDSIIHNDNLVKYFGDLITLEIPNGIKCISSEAFSEAKNLKKVIVPNSVMLINKYAFRGSKVDEVEISKINPYVRIVDGVIYSRGSGSIMSSIHGRKRNKV